MHTYATDAQQMAEWGIDAFKVWLSVCLHMSTAETRASLTMSC